MNYNLNRKLSIATGILILLVIFAQTYALMIQPVCNTGVSYVFTDDNIFIEKVNPNSPGGRAGIKQGQTFYKFDNSDIHKWMKLRNSTSFGNYMLTSSTYLKFGSRLSFETKEGQVYSFIITKQNLFNEFINMPGYALIEFFVSILIIISGLACSIIFKNKTLIWLNYFQYFVALTLYNAYTTTWQSISTTQISIILFDIGGVLTVIFFFKYISESFNQFNILPNMKKIFFFLQLLCFGLMLIKYLIIFIFNWNIMDNPLLFLAQLELGLSSIPVIIFGTRLTIKLPKQTTVVFRFVILGVSCSFLPAASVLLYAAFARNFYMNAYYYLISIAPFILVPSFIWLSYLQEKGETAISFSKKAACFLIYLTISVIFIVLTRNDSIKRTNIELIIYILLSPVIYQLILIPINQVLAYENNNIFQLMQNYSRSINDNDDFLQISRKTIKVIENLVDCMFVYIQIFDTAGEENASLISKQEISNEYLRNISKEANRITKKRDYSVLSTGDLEFTFHKDNLKYSRIIVGKKNNSDIYFEYELNYLNTIANTYFNKLTNMDSINAKHLLFETNKRIINMQKDTILSMANLIESRDGGTGSHVRRTAVYSELIARKAIEKKVYPDELNEKFVQLLSRAAPMHDIGKIVVADHILKKPDKLTDEEFDEMKLHTTEGYRIANEVLLYCENEEYLKMVQDIAISHHEKWNGTGYPKQLKETQIPLSARIMAIADVFDALVSPRCYKEPIPEEKAFEIIEKDSGIHFDPVLTEIFLEIKDEIIKAKQSFDD